MAVVIFTQFLTGLILSDSIAANAFTQNIPTHTFFSYQIFDYDRFIFLISFFYSSSFRRCDGHGSLVKL